MVVVLLFVCPAARCADTLAFRCISVYENPKAEEQLLRHAPHGARRISKRQIEVAWSGAKRVFADAPPYDEPLDGVRWVYCGYSPGLKLHLLLKRENSLFTGALLDDSTGSLLAGGQEVLFSPGNRYYLAYEMEDGDVTEVLKLYRINGELLWSGNNGLVSDDGSLLANFRDLRWNAPDKVQAVAVPYDGSKPFVVALTLHEKTGWGWDPLPSQIHGFHVEPGRSREK
jgi:hypothetical protein